MTSTREPWVVRDALLVTQNARREVRRGDLRIEDGRFTHVGPDAPRDGAEVIDGHGFAAVPGFINAHTHVAMAPLRGAADDVDLAGFLEILFRLDADRTEADVEAGAKAGIAEMLLGGTTSFLDLYYFEDAVGRACTDLGIRGFLGWAVLDPDRTTQSGVPLDNARRFLARWKDHPTVEPLVAPQGVYVVGRDTWLAAVELARSTGRLLHYHLSETRQEVHAHEQATGQRPVIWLDAIGALGRGQIAAHAVWLTGREIELLGRHGVAIAHCPSSNEKLASGGFCPVVELRRAGAPVALGTDSVASNNSLSMLREMHLAGLAQKNHRWEAAALPAGELLDLATREGAKALGRADELGSLEVGKRADFSLFRLDHPTLFPARPETIIPHLAYSASEEAIDSVSVNGEWVVRHRSLVRRPWATILKEATEAAESLWARRSELT